MKMSSGTVPVVAIGGSAGGIEATWALLAALPADLPAAVLVVIHQSPRGVSNLAGVLGQRSALPVKAAEDGEALQAGQVYVGLPDLHLMIEGSMVLCVRGPRECRVRPAVNVLFRSVAESCGAKAIGVVVSGALDDGTAGLWAIKRLGGHAFVQDPLDAQYDSMPRSALEHVSVDGVASARGLGPLVVEAVRAAASSASPAPAAQGIESQLAAGHIVGESAVFELGQRSRFACPECHGVLVEIKEDGILRFRCHTGHGYSSQTLAAELDDGVEESLWNAVRALEEKALLLKRALSATPDLEQEELERVHRRLETLRSLLVST